MREEINELDYGLLISLLNPHALLTPISQEKASVLQLMTEVLS
jgi:hypothetical protein